jgi:hypothetical protein
MRLLALLYLSFSNANLSKKKQHRQLGPCCKHISNNILEREMGFEPTTLTLARLHSTTELFPLN